MSAYHGTVGNRSRAGCGLRDAGWRPLIEELRRSLINHKYRK